MGRPRKPEKRIPLYRTIALAHAFATAASKGTEDKIIKAIQHAVKYDKDMGTEVMSRIAFEMRSDVTTLKKLRVHDLKESYDLHTQLHDVFEGLANEMENAIQTLAEGNQERNSDQSDNRKALRVVAPPTSELWYLRRKVA